MHRFSSDFGRVIWKLLTDVFDKTNGWLRCTWRAAFNVCTQSWFCSKIFVVGRTRHLQINTCLAMGRGQAWYFDRLQPSTWSCLRAGLLPGADCVGYTVGLEQERSNLRGTAMLPTNPPPSTKHMFKFVATSIHCLVCIFSSRYSVTFNIP